MRYLAAYLLCQLGGKENPTESDLKSVLNSVGIEHDSEKLSSVMSSLSGKDITQLIAEGSKKISSVPAAGAVASAPAQSAPAAAAKTEAPKESKPAKEEVKEESESEEDMGFGLFD